MYFAEWQFDADIRSAFPVIDQIARKSGIHEIAPEWVYGAPLNFYRLYYHDDFFAPFTFGDPLVAGKPIYVMGDARYAGFIKKNNLKVVFRGSFSDLEIAVQPAVADAIGFKPEPR